MWGNYSRLDEGVHLQCLKVDAEGGRRSHLGRRRMLIELGDIVENAPSNVNETYLSIRTRSAPDSLSKQRKPTFSWVRGP